MGSGPGNAATAALKAVPPWECLHLLVRQATGWVCLECGAEEGNAPQAGEDGKMSNSNQGGPAGQGSDSEATCVLRAARARVERGWCKGSKGYTETDATEQCALGAIRAEDDLRSGEAWAEAANLLRRVAVGNDGSLTRWNDEPERTQADILAAFDKAIALAEGNAPLAAPPGLGSAFAIPSPAPPETP